MYKASEALYNISDTLIDSGYICSRVFVVVTHGCSNNVVITCIYCTTADIFYLQDHGVAFMETSAKTGMNVELAFMAIARYVLNSVETSPTRAQN